MPVIVLTVTLGLGPTLASAQQQMPPSQEPMMMTMPSKMVAGVITAVRYASCGGGPQDCQGIFVVTPSPRQEIPGGMMPVPTGHAERAMGSQPITVIFVPNTPFMWQGSPLPLTRLKAGDTVMLGYRTLGGMNVVVGGMLVGMGRM
jgi:hypothetical protein